ncbi:interleukin-18 receptor 1-like isoform X2 [Pristis pectinata]|uniref:interleukin-18 receptor 1-like isoform X2 n=1 Tax=Pristis pectinata TaxID=685728 RepID=UPI00223CD1E0|nr:interleukin-18 receptor 1-like isoform X2 [Pristis pectinata]
MVMDVKYLVLITFCYVVGRIQGSLTSKCFPYKSGLVFVTEGEHVRLTCNLYNAFTPLDMSNLQAHRLNISWFKHTSEGGHKKLLGEAGRITYEGTSLGFWPAFVNDTGNYTCSVFNRTYNVSSAGTSLNVHRNEGLCSDCFFSRTESVGKSIRLSCPKLKDYNSKEDNIIWMKDCKDKVHTGNAYTILKVEEKSAGYYSCVLTVGKDGVQYNVTRTIKLKTKGYVERFIPKLVYPGRKEQIEVELGDKREIECKAVLGYKNNLFCMLYWRYKNRFFEINGTVYEGPVRNVSEGNRIYMIRPLVFKGVKAEHLNEPFTCALDCPETNLNGNITLLEKGKHDTSLIFLLLFTTLAVIIIVAVVYVRFKIDFVLCFRDLTSRDETLQDGKEYDAYVLLLKSNEALISAEGETFALKLLPAILEQKFGYRLCIYERDVLPGAASASEILSYINKSRTLIIILCAECMANDSSTYGLMTGLHQALVERLIKPILIEYLPIRDITLLPQSLQLILKSDRSVKWTNESLSQNSYFWKKIS